MHIQSNRETFSISTIPEIFKKDECVSLCLRAEFSSGFQSQNQRHAFDFHTMLTNG